MRAEILSPDVFLGHRDGTEFLLLNFLLIYYISKYVFVSRV